MASLLTVGALLVIGTIMMGVLVAEPAWLLMALMTKKKPMPKLSGIPLCSTCYDRGWLRKWVPVVQWLALFPWKYRKVKCRCQRPKVREQLLKERAVMFQRPKPPQGSDPSKYVGPQDLSRASGVAERANPPLLGTPQTPSIGAYLFKCTQCGQAALRAGETCQPCWDDKLLMSPPPPPKKGARPNLVMRPTVVEGWL